MPEDFFCRQMKRDLGAGYLIYVGQIDRSEADAALKRGGCAKVVSVATMDEALALPFLPLNAAGNLDVGRARALGLL